MKYLSLEQLKKNLEKAPDAEFVTTAPAGFEDGFFKNFLRVLTEPAENLTDVTDDEIIKMLENGEKLFSTLELSDTSFEDAFRRLSSCVSNVSTFKRRIL